MAYFNQEKKQPTVNTYSAITFTNPDSPIMQSRLSISYFNKTMCLTFEPRDMMSSIKEYPTYNKDLAIKGYLSYTKAKILLEAMKDMFRDPKKEKHNVAVAVNSGMIKISNGIEYGANSPCISMLYVDKDGNNSEILYHTKINYEAFYNYTENNFSRQSFPNFEIQTFMMVLEQYYLASSYAIAASVAENNMYRESSHIELLKSIADKVGAGNNGYSYKTNSKTYASKSLLAGKTDLTPTDDNQQQIPVEYSSQSFDDMLDNISSGSLFDDDSDNALLSEVDV